METLTRTRPKASDLYGDMDHWYCCDPDVSMCGLDISDLSENEMENICIACDRILVCSECGHNFEAEVERPQ